MCWEVEKREKVGGKKESGAGDVKDISKISLFSIKSINGRLKAQIVWAAKKVLIYLHAGLLCTVKVAR